LRQIVCLFMLAIASAFPIDAARKKPSGKEPAKKTDVAADINKPRADARKISFTTSEGTWMSVDLSPDGSTLAFDLLGDIYLMPASGGIARAITKGPAIDGHPRFSPDGKLIAFSSDRSGIDNIWLMNADGKDPRALTTEKDSYVRSAAWSPDGRFVIARKEEGKRGGIPPVELWLFHVYGGSGIKVTSSDDLSNAAGPLFSPDGRYIYFSARHANFSYTPNLTTGLWQVERFDRRTGEVTPLTSGYGGASRPLLSPDGKRLIFVTRRDAQSHLVERNLASGRERIVVRNVTRDEQEGFVQADLWPNYTFTRDGSSLIYTNRGRFERFDFATGKVAAIPFTANVEQWLAPRVTFQEKVPTGPVAGRILRWPTQSPDGKWLAFDAFGRIWIQELSAGKAVGSPRRLTADSKGLPPREYAPSFSNDGRWIAYVTWSDASAGHAWKAELPASGSVSTPQRLTATEGHYANPRWSPRDDRLLIIQGTGLEFRGRQPEEESFFEIRWLSSNGGDTNFITTVKIADTLKFHPLASWAADGTRIYYRDPVPQTKPSDDPRNELVSVRLDGSDKKRHLRFPAIGDLLPSPDEQWVVFTSRDNVYVAALPQTQTKEPPEVGTKEGAVPVWRLSDEAGGYVGWADGGKTITWSLAAGYHRLPVASAIRFVEEQKKKEEAKSKKEGDKPDEPEVDELRVPKSEVIRVDLKLPRPVHSESIVLRGARVITMKGEEVLEKADIVVTGNRIAAIGAAGKVVVPAGARELEVSGKTIIPGLIDTHAHLHYSGFEIFPETKWEYIANLAYGVTTVYDPSAPSLDVFAQAEMIEANQMLGPRVFSSGDVLYGGQQADYFAEVNDQDDARRQVRRMKAYGARMIKVYQQPRRDQRLWFAEACREQKMLLTAEGAGELFTDLSMAIDGYTAFEHSLPVELYEDVVRLIAESKTHYTPTLLVSYGGPWGEQYFWQTRNPHADEKLNRFTPHLTIDPKARRFPWITPEEYHFPVIARGVARVAHAGGNVSLGAHGQLQGLGVDWELWAMAGEGDGTSGQALTNHEALKAATIMAADKIGFSPDLGSIETGKLADLVVLNANPLEDIHATADLQWVMKDGRLYDASSMNGEWPEQQQLPRFFWSE